MPPTAPPTAARTTPNRAVLPAGTRLWRVHRGTRGAGDFKPIPADPHFGGGRFDSMPGDDEYPYLYAAPDPRTALLETLVRSIPFDDHGLRYLRRAALGGMVLSAVRNTADIAMVSLLSTADLAASCQDEWLINADPHEYPQTRRWARWLRGRAPWGQGLLWTSRRDVGRPSAILFGDRVDRGVLTAVPGSAVALDDAAGARWLNEQLAPYRIRVKPPRTARPR